VSNYAAQSHLRDTDGNSDDGRRRSPPMIWRCPYCIGSLHDEYASLRCGACCRTFPVFDGIPDLRTAHPSWIDLTAEHSYARKLLAEQMEASPEEWVRASLPTRRLTKALALHYAPAK